MNTPAAVAAFNNAVWCDTVCRAAGGVTRWTDRLWMNVEASSPFFPNVVTLQPDADADEACQALQALVHRDVEVAVKDSFGVLDLSPLGLSRLFDARWIWRAPVPEAPESRRLHWRVVESAAELRAWEAAWWPDTPDAAPGTPVFGDALLQNTAMAFLGGFDGNRLVAGGATMVTPGFIGLGCLFFHVADVPSARREFLSVVTARCPGVPLGGYEAGGDLEAMQACGFRDVGALTVWFGKVAGHEAA